MFADTICNCGAHGHCNMITGLCECDLGYYGEGCDVFDYCSYYEDLNNKTACTDGGKLSPADTQHQNDVVLTSMRRDHVASTLIRRHFNVVCPLGSMLGINARIQHFEIFVLLPQKIVFDISCKLLLLEIICMTGQGLFSWNNKKHFTSVCCLLHLPKE